MKPNLGPACLGMVTGCVLLATPVAAQQRTSSQDGFVSVVIPATWESMDLNPEADLQFGSEVEAAFLVIMNESKQDMFGWNLTRHSMITLAGMLQTLDFPEVEGPDTLTLGGYPAVQYRMVGIGQGTRIVYLHTTIDGPTAFSQVAGWTVASRWGDFESTIWAILESIEFDEEAATNIPKP